MTKENEFSRSDAVGLTFRRFASSSVSTVRTCLRPRPADELLTKMTMQSNGMLGLTMQYQRQQQQQQVGNSFPFSDLFSFIAAFPLTQVS